MIVDFLRRHWKGALVLLLCFGALQVAPDWAISAFFGLILALFIGVVLYVYIMDRLLIRRVTRHIEQLGYSVVEIKEWQQHYGVTFMAGEEKHYVRFAHSASFGKLVDWIDEPPKMESQDPRRLQEDG